MTRTPRGRKPAQFYARLRPGWAVIVAGAVIGLGVAAYWSVRLAYADTLAIGNTIPRLEQAIRLAPANARYRMALADLLDQSGGDPRPPLLEAAQLNPSDASTWIQLGLHAELHGDIDRAEKYLLRAAASRQFRPRAALANFYFRQDRREAFWTWTKAALATGYPAPFPLFRLALTANPDSTEVLRRAIPDESPVLALYLRFLLYENRVADAGAVAAKLATRAVQGIEPLLLETCEKLLRIRDAEPALRIWNALAARAATPYTQLDPNRGASLTNGDLRVRPASIAFDWHLVPADGIRVDTTASRTLTVVFSGQQSDRHAPLAQWLPLKSGQKYRLAFEVDAPTMSAESSGLYWRVRDAATDSELLERADIAGTTRWQRHEVVFSSSPETGLAILSLEYARPPGSKPITGTIGIRDVTLGFAE